MKKIIKIFIVFVAILSLSGCTTKKESSAKIIMTRISCNKEVNDVNEDVKYYINLSLDQNNKVSVYEEVAKHTIKYDAYYNEMCNNLSKKYSSSIYNSDIKSIVRCDEDSKTIYDDNYYDISKISSVEDLPETDFKAFINDDFILDRSGYIEILKTINYTCISK